MKSPKAAEDFTKDMQLDVRVKDVIFEPLNQPDFLQSLKIGEQDKQI